MKPVKKGDYTTGSYMDLTRITGFSLLGICDRRESMSIQEPKKFHALEIQARKTIRKFAMLTSGDHVLVAVSGGADSTALLHSLHRLSSEFQLALTVAHLNHCIRGAEGDSDAEFVRTMCLDLGLPFVSETIEVKQQALAFRKNLEEWARNLRYDFLRRTATRIGATRIAIGHNINDQAETALFRFLRGSGVEGLSAIHPVIDSLIVRPLLQCSRELIRDYLIQQHINYCEDSTNTDLKHARNRIRRELIPYLQTHFNPQLLEALARETDHTREIWEFMKSQASAAYHSLHSLTTDGISLRIPLLLDLHPALQKQVLRHALKECIGSLRGIGMIHIQNLLSLCTAANSGERIDLPHGGTALRQFDALLLLNHEPKTAPVYAYTLDIPGQCHVLESAVTFLCQIVETPSLPAMKDAISHQAFLNMETLPKQLRIRPRIPGDRYGGLGHRKVKKMLIDSKIPFLQRESIPMIVAGNDVVWIPGFRPAQNYAAKPVSGTCLMVEVSKG
jgi:tRNA(Ile)-lysidine synthase